MGLLSFLFNRAPAGRGAMISLTAPSASALNPQERLGDPLAALRPETIDRDYRNRINRGELAIPTWALHEALRLLPLLANYVRLWTDALTGLDWNIKTVDGSDEGSAKAQADALRSAYEGLDVTGTVSHLALANLYGYSGLAKHPGKLEPLNWWNFARVGLYGEWKWNPDLRVVDGKSGSLQDIDPAQYVIREVEGNCLLEYLRIYLRASAVEGYWDGNLEKESRRQVVIIPGQGLSDSDAEKFKAAAVDIMLGRSGALAAGTGDKTTQAVFPPESRGLPYYENRLKMLDEWACKALFGAPLIANTAPDSGTLAGNAHQDTAAKRIVAAAAHISATLQEQFDRGVLEAAGLLRPGEKALAYFELAPEEQKDPAEQVDQAVKLAAVFQLDPAEWSERLGVKLAAKAAPPPMEDGADGPFDGLENWDPSQPREEDGQFAEAPDRISAEDADKLLDAGFDESDAEGEKVRFGRRLKDKLDKMPDARQRKEHLPWAREAVKTGKKTRVVEKGEARHVYSKVFRHEGDNKGLLAIVDVKDGEAFDHYRYPVKKLLKRYGNRGGMHQADGQPSECVLQAIAAAGGLPDYWYPTRRDLLVNRTAESLGVPDSWLRPVRDLLAEIEAKAVDKSLSDAELLAYLENAQRRLPELFGEMDVDAFAEVLTAGMGEAAVEGVRDAIRAKA
jgi:hypothetical protein